MSDNTAIEWTDSTFNPWTGCTKVSPACDHCYAEAWSRRAGEKVGKWGRGAARVRTTEANWRKPLEWNRWTFFECASCGWRGDSKLSICLGTGTFRCPRCFSDPLTPARRRVFCASLADVFDNEVDPQWRADLFALVRATPNLDWLLLTKRIGNAASMIAAAVSALPRDSACGTGQFNHTPMAQWPWPNVWLGATICNQAEADRDIPKLLATPARTRFLSIEPMLGPINFRWQPYAHQASGESYRQYLERRGSVNHLESLHLVNWVIAGGESGRGARPMHPEWVRSLRDQCAAACVPFLFKQWGEYMPADADDCDAGIERSRLTWSDGAEWHEGDGQRGGVALMARVGKKAAGRILDGVVHDGFPQ